MKFTPHQYQIDGARWLVQHPEAALFWEPGLGKTAVALTAFNALRRAGAVRRALVVAPLRVAYAVWSARGEVGRWNDFAQLRVALLHGTKKAQALDVDADLYVINYDGIRWLIESGGLKSLLDRGVDLLIFDELSKMKHAKTQRFIAFKPWLGRFARRWGLTGTPVANGLLDLFGQAYVLDLGRALGRFITHYRRTYFTPTNRGVFVEWTPQPDAEPRIFTALAPLAQSLKATDCLELPELVERDVWVDLPDRAQMAYRELDRELITTVNDVTLSAKNAAVALMKCRQLCGGAIYHDEPVTHGVRGCEELHDAKLEALADLVDELQGQPLLVAYEFQHELARLRTRFGADVPALGGQTHIREAANIIDAWNARALPLLLAHPASAGHGLNLQRGGSHVAWFTLPWDLELYIQLNDRVWRQGNEAARVIVHRFLARHTVDVDIRDLLARKRGGQEALFAALRAPERAGGPTETGAVTLA